MNPNYTEFKFPQIKAHPWTKVSQQVQEPFSFLLYKIHVMSDRPPSVLVTPPQHTLLHPASPPPSPRSHLLVRLVSAASRFFFCCAHPGRRCGMPWNFTLLSSSCFSELSFSYNMATFCSGCPRSVSRSLENACVDVLILLMMSGGKMLSKMWILFNTLSTEAQVS